MPAKQNQITEEERAKRIRDAARDLETSDDPKDFEKAFEKVAVAPTATKPRTRAAKK